MEIGACFADQLMTTLSAHTSCIHSTTENRTAWDKRMRVYP